MIKIKEKHIEIKKVILGGKKNDSPIIYLQDGLIAYWNFTDQESNVEDYKVVDSVSGIEGDIYEK